jgi:hypothetical protein
LAELGTVGVQEMRPLNSDKGSVRQSTADEIQLPLGLVSPFLDIAKRHQAAGTDTQQSDALGQWHSLQALSRRLADFGRISRTGGEGNVSSYRLEIGVSQFDADSPAGVSLARKVLSNANAQ